MVAHLSLTRIHSHLRGCPLRLLWVMCLLTLSILVLSLLLLDLDADPDHSPSEVQTLSTTRNLLHQNMQTGSSEPGIRQLTLNAADIEALTTFIFLRKNWESHTHCKLLAPKLQCRLSLRLLRGIPGFLNGEILMDASSQGLNIQQLRIGRVLLPPTLATWLLEHLTVSILPNTYLRLQNGLVRNLAIEDHELRVSLNWNDELFDKAETWVQDLVSKERFMVYHTELRRVLTAGPHKRFVRLAPLVQTLFNLARERSSGELSPSAENAAAIMVLNTYVNGGTPAGWLPQAPKTPRLQVLLKGRVDTAQHFLASAALTLSGNNTWTDLMGLAKELNDTHGGSGFSFIDLAADRSGVLFARTATASDSSARATQRLLSQNTDETGFMADIRDLPENLDASSFRDRYHSLDSPEFTALQSLIENRIAALAIHRAVFDIP